MLCQKCGKQRHRVDLDDDGVCVFCKEEFKLSERVEGLEKNVAQIKMVLRKMKEIFDNIHP